MVGIKIKKLNAMDKYMPTKANEEAACYDVYVNSIISVQEYIEYGLGFSTEIPPGYKGVIVPRSSISKYDLIMCNSPAQIDSDYRGEWKVRFKKVPGSSKYYDIGERCAQIYFEEVLNIEFVEKEELNTSNRGNNAFGSTGI